MKPLRRLAFCILAVGPALAWSAPVPYRTRPESCGDFPQAPIETEEGTCVGLVVQGGLLRRPRRIVQIPGRHEFVISDIGTWERPSEGRLLWLTFRRRVPELRVLMSGLRWPHGLQVGPDAQIYVGELGRIFRIDPARFPRVEPETVIDDVVDDPTSLHPLAHFAFGRSVWDRWDIYLNVGSPGDACEGAVDERGLCLEDVRDQRAVVLRYRYMGDYAWESRSEVFARGLRNSMGLVSHPSGTLIQLDNARNIKEGVVHGPLQSFDELNILRPGRHYGWPYCMNFNFLSPDWQGFAGFDCEGSDFEQPWVLLPPHSAPLDAIYYERDFFPDLKSRLLISLRGSLFGTGHRVIALEVDEAGRPKLSQWEFGFPFTDAEGERTVLRTPPLGDLLRHAEITEVIADWHEIPGLRPRGTPVGMGVDDDGRLWIVDDTNAAILRLDRGQAYRRPPNFEPSPRPVDEQIENDPELKALWERASRQVFQTRCASCHRMDLKSLVSRPRWLDFEEPRESLLLKKMDGRARPIMPPSGRLREDLLDIVREWLDSLSRVTKP